jgi:hypothetical protein
VAISLRLTGLLHGDGERLAAALRLLDELDVENRLPPNGAGLRQRLSEELRGGTSAGQ